MPAFSFFGIPLCSFPVGATLVTATSILRLVPLLGSTIVYVYGSIVLANFARFHPTFAVAAPASCGCGGVGKGCEWIPCTTAAGDVDQR